jgi:lipopolysaccharide/colanic/teichoic acid biosynthesis glycosyltransferase
MVYVYYPHEHPWVDVKRASAHPRGATSVWPLRIKRAIDITVAAAGLVFLSPLIAGVAVAIRLSMGPPVLFRQHRPGHLGRPFTLLKFRSMHSPEEFGSFASEDQLVTGLGRVLRRTSIDEIPQLWNVLRGDMSLVGPRPLAMEYLPLYSPEQGRRHDMLPGVTGWAQVTGRHDLRWEDRFKRDVWYIDNWSLWLDLKIMAMTARVLLSGTSVIPPPEADFHGGAPLDPPS